MWMFERKGSAERGKKSAMDDKKGNLTTTTTITPLTGMAIAFEDLSKTITDSKDLDLGTFCEACSHVSILFGCLGIAFKFAEMEYVAKVSNLAEAAKRYNSLQEIIDVDVGNGTVRNQGSYSRSLRRVRLGLDLIRVLFQQFLSADDHSLKDAASMAYAQVCAPYHSWAVRTAVSAGMYALPSREQLLLKMHETEQSADKKMRRYIKASVPVIEYIDSLYISRNISLDW